MLEISPSSTRVTIVRPCPNQGLSHANLPAPRRSRTTRPQIFCPANSANSVAAAGSPPPIRAYELVEFVTRHSALAPNLHASADSRNSYAHAAGSLLTRRANIPSAAAPEPPRCTRRSHVVPRLTSSPCSSLSRKPPLPMSRALTHSNHAATAVGAPRWPQASAWVAGRPQRGARGRPPFLDVPGTGHPLHKKSGLDFIGDRCPSRVQRAQKIEHGQGTGTFTVPGRFRDRQGQL